MPCRGNLGNSSGCGIRSLITFAPSWGRTHPRARCGWWRWTGPRDFRPAYGMERATRIPSSSTTGLVSFTDSRNAPPNPSPPMIDWPRFGHRWPNTWIAVGRWRNSPPPSTPAANTSAAVAIWKWAAAPCITSPTCACNEPNSCWKLPKTPWKSFPNKSGIPTASSSPEPSKRWMGGTSPRDYRSRK